MANKRFWLGISVLVFGLAVVGCDDNGNGNGGTFNLRNAYTYTPELLTFSIGTDGIITINVIQQTQMDMAHLQIPYSGIKNTTFVYKFEAWTATGTRDVRVSFGREVLETGFNFWPSEVITITPTRQLFELEHLISNLTATFNLSFNVGGEIGVIYINIISIEAK